MIFDGLAINKTHPPCNIMYSEFSFFASNSCFILHHYFFLQFSGKWWTIKLLTKVVFVGDEFCVMLISYWSTRKYESQILQFCYCCCI